MNNFKNLLPLFGCSIIWGTSFIFQSTAMNSIGPIWFIFSRMIVGGIALLPFYILTEAKTIKTPDEKGILPTEEENKKRLKDTLLGGFLLGITIMGGALFQQIGLLTTSTGKSAFITSMYIVMVPVFGLFIGRKTKAAIWISAVLGIIGLALICLGDDLSISFGDAMTFVCAIFYAFDVMVTDHYAPKVNTMGFISVSAIAAALMALVLGMFMEDVTPQSFVGAIPSILYCGIMSTGVAYLLQAIGQKKNNPTVSAVIMSTQSVFAAIAGFLILHEILTPRESLGCVIMLIAVILPQLNFRREN